MSRTDLDFAVIGAGVSGIGAGHCPLRDEHLRFARPGGRLPLDETARSEPLPT